MKISGSHTPFCGLAKFTEVKWSMVRAFIHKWGKLKTAPTLPSMGQHLIQRGHWRTLATTGVTWENSTVKTTNDHTVFIRKQDFLHLSSPRNLIKLLWCDFETGCEWAKTSPQPWPCESGKLSLRTANQVDVRSIYNSREEEHIEQQKNWKANVAGGEHSQHTQHHNLLE